MAQSQMQDLMSMGYTESQAKQALEIADGDMEQAVGYLLMGDSSKAQIGDGLAEANGSSMVSLPEDTAPPHAAIHRLPGAYAEGGNKMQELMSMGYAKDAAEEALQIANGDMDQAINYLLMGDSRAGFQVDEMKNPHFGGMEHDAAMAAILQQDELVGNHSAISAHLPRAQQIPNSSNVAGMPESAMYHATTLQNNGDIPRMVVTQTYLMTEGAGPFCACMAASKFLNGGIVTAEFLNGILEGGIELFRKHDSQDWDVAKVLKKCGKSTLKIEGVDGEQEPKDVVFLNNDRHHVLGIRKQLALCRNLQPAGWQVLILEIPSFESMMIALPPKGSKNKFWYLDFYPRTIFRVSGAHARVHTTLLQLEESLEAIFTSLTSLSRKDYEHFKIHTIKKTKNSRP